MSKQKYPQKTEPITEEQLFKMANTALLDVLERFEKIVERITQKEE